MIAVCFFVIIGNKRNQPFFYRIQFLCRIIIFNYRTHEAVDQIVKQNDQGHGADKSAVMAEKIEYAPQLMIRKSTGPARTSD